MAEKKTMSIWTDVTGNRQEIELNLSETPLTHIREVAEKNPDMFVGLFPTSQSRKDFIKGELGLDTEASVVSLVRNGETIKTFDLNIPFSEQMDTELKITDEAPEFLVSAKMVVG